MILILVLVRFNSNVLSFRPATRHATIDRAYFVGASAHPGTGVPICLAGARLTADQILEDFGLPIPWRLKQAEAAEAKHRATVKVLDQPHSSIAQQAMLISILTAVIACLAAFSPVFLREFSGEGSNFVLNLVKPRMLNQSLAM